MTTDVTAIIPTIGRASLAGAIESVLTQSHPVAELIVVADTDEDVDIPDEPRITLLRSTGEGPARCRQLGIDAAHGDVTALLDDDDTWHRDKIARQLSAVRNLRHRQWIVSSRSELRGRDRDGTTWPRRTIERGEPLAEYLFRRTSMTSGETLLQTSTLCFPTELARTVRWDAHSGAAKDEPSWLLRVNRRFPDLEVIQVPEALSTYSIAGESRSRSTADRTDRYIAWGLDYLGRESPRVLGDYLCTSPVSAAVSAGSLRGANRALVAALRHGRPGPAGLGYAALNWWRIAARWRPAHDR